MDDTAQKRAFCRAVGVAIPAEADMDDYVVVHLHNGIRMSWSTLAVERDFNPDWAPPSEPGRIGLSFRLATPADVDEAMADWWRWASFAEPNAATQQRHIGSYGWLPCV